MLLDKILDWCIGIAAVVSVIAITGMAVAIWVGVLGYLS